MYKKFIPCRKCVKTLKTPEGYFLITVEKDGGKYNVLQECNHHKIWRQQEDVYSKFIDSNFDVSKFEFKYPEGYLGIKSIEELNQLVNLTNSFKNDKFLIVYLYGNNGCQKTALANWIGKTLIQKGYNTKYVFMKQLIDSLWNAQRSEDAQYYCDKLLKCDFLIIDESFDKEKIHMWESGKQLGYIDQFIRTRRNNNRSMLFISNHSMDEILKQGFSFDIQDLIKRETYLAKSYFELKDNYVDEIGQIPKEKVFRSEIEGNFSED